MKKSLLLMLIVLSGTFLLIPAEAIGQKGPQPGDVYKEYAVSLRTGRNWRVTDPTVTRPDAVVFLPNPVLSITIGDLQDATRAEVLMDIWGGHVGTSNKQFRFNLNPWIRIPELPTIDFEPECYMSQYNVIMDMPLEYLVEGVNTFEGTSGGQICNNYNWGQWGWYVMMVRVYYDPAKKPHTRGHIEYPVSGSVIVDNPVIRVVAEHPDSVNQVQFLGKYLGFDQKGQGYFYDWHWAYHSIQIEGYIGTTFNPPFNRTWNTTWVPDQEPESVAFKARIRGKNGVWYVTDVVDNITLDRSEAPSVKMYTATDIPKPFVVRILGNGNPRTRDCKIHIPGLADAIEARFIHRTWNAADDDAARGTITLPLGINGNGHKTMGINHFYALSSFNIPVSNLKEGENLITYTSNTTHHGIEVLWPGPAILVRYDKTQTGMKPDPAQNDIVIFPNPTSNILYYDAENIVSLHQIDLLDLTGKVIITDKQANGSLYTGHVKPGLYFVRFSGNDFLITQRIIIL